MNILYLAHRIPFPPNKGDKLRAFRQLEHLARNHRLWCACFVDTPSDWRYIAPLTAYCEDLAAVPLNRTWATMRGLGSLIRGGTVTESFYRHTAMTGALNDWCASVDFDVVVAFSSSMAPYALQVPAARRVLDLCDLDSHKWLDYAASSGGPVTWLYRIEGNRLAIRERTWIRAFDAAVFITKAEAATVWDTAPRGKLHIVTNGVDLPDLNESHRSQTRAAGFSLRDPTVGFVGVMDYQPNVDAVCWFVDQCWREIREACPTTVFRIIGRSPTRRVRKLATVPGVHVVGGVEDVSTELRRFDVSIAPMRLARGLQNKVLEAMAAGKPVVLTSQAAKGINARDTRDYLVADTADRMVRRVARLLRDRSERERIGLAARRFVAVHHRWEDALQRFELIVTGVTQRATQPATLHAQALAIQPADPIGAGQ